MMNDAKSAPVSAWFGKTPSPWAAATILGTDPTRWKSRTKSLGDTVSRLMTAAKAPTRPTMKRPIAQRATARTLNRLITPVITISAPAIHTWPACDVTSDV